jgi:hypothetical protein
MSDDNQAEGQSFAERFAYTGPRAACPWCSSTNLEFSTDVGAITCNGCLANGPDATPEMEEAAWRKWNARAAEASK